MTRRARPLGDRALRRRPVLRAAFIPLLLLVVAACAPVPEAVGPPRLSLEGEARQLLDAGFDADVAVFFGSEIMGSLDGCGCMGSPQLGGLPFRSAYVEGFRDAFPGAAYLQLDAGYSTTAIASPEGEIVPDFLVRNEWVVTALDRLGFDAANLTAHDIPFFARYLGRDAWAAAARERPMLARYVSANLEPLRPALVKPPAYVVRTIRGASLPADGLRVAITGVTEPAKGTEAASGFRVVDPADALERVLPGARREADLVVVLAYMSPRAADALRERVAADLYVVAHSLGEPPPPALEGPVRAVYSTYKTQQLGELALHVDGGAIASARARYVTLDRPLPRDPLAERIVAEAKEAVRATREQRYREAGEARRENGRRSTQNQQTILSDLR